MQPDPNAALVIESTEPRLTPESTVTDIIAYLRWRDANLFDTLERLDTHRTTAQYRNARAIRGEVQNQLIALDPTYRPLQDLL